MAARRALATAARGSRSPGPMTPRRRRSRRVTRSPRAPPAGDARWPPLRVPRPTPRLHLMVQPAIRSRPSTSVAAEVEIGHALDAESCDWLQTLSDTGPTREAAVERLHALLLRAARF